MEVQALRIEELTNQLKELEGQEHEASNNMRLLNGLSKSKEGEMCG